MNPIDLGKSLSAILPRLRTRIQLGGLVVIVVLGALVSLVKPGDNIALTLAGGVGVGLIVFAQLFHFLTTFDAASRPRVFLVSFLAFLFFIVVLLVLLIIQLRPAREPSVDITPVAPGETVAEPQSHSSLRKSFSGASAAAFLPAALLVGSVSSRGSLTKLPPVANSGLGQTMALPKRKSADDVSYVFSSPGGISTLIGTFSYIDWSRGDQYPNADFHQGVHWGWPSIWYNISNPTDAPLFFTQLQADIEHFEFINEVIIDIPEIDGYVPGEKHPMTLINRGWGIAKNATLRLWAGSEQAANTYVIIGAKTYSLGVFDSEAEVDIADLVPKNATWNRFSHSTKREDGYLTAIGRLDYVTEDGKPRYETFRSTIYQTFGGGGNVPWSAYYNLQLPDAPEQFPVILALSDCIAARSADKFMLRFTARRSARYRLKLSVKDTTGKVITKRAAVDVIVPRSWHRHMPPSTGKFLENANNQGCR